MTRVIKNLIVLAMTVVMIQACDSTDPEPKVLPKISISDASGTEGGLVNFSITMDTTSAEDVTVKYSTSNGTATDADFSSPTAETLTIPAGTKTLTLSILLTPDTEQEASETFKVTLSDPRNAQLSSDAEAIGTIINKAVSDFFLKVKIGTHQWSATFLSDFFSPTFIDRSFAGYGSGTDSDSQLAFVFYEAPTGPKTYQIEDLMASDNNHVSVFYSPTFFSSGILGPSYNAQPGGEVKLTRYDVVNGVAEGTFKFTAINPDNNQKLEFTEGQFKIKIED